MRQFALIFLFLTVPVFSAFSQILFEDFEHSGALPDGWVSTWEGGSVEQFNWRCNNGGFEVPENAFEGSYNAYLRNDNGSFQDGAVRLELPPLDLSAYSNSNVAVSFWQTNIYDSFLWNEMKVFYKAGQDDEWIELAFIENETVSWTKRQYLLPKPYTDDYRISFLGYETKSNGICIDNVSVFEYFYPPQNLSSSSADGQVELNWEAPQESEGLTGYKIYRNREVLAETGTDLTYTDNDVSNHTAYEYYLTALFGENESDQSNEVFEAPLGMLLPFFEGFENNGEKPYGWEQVYEFSEHDWVFQAGGRDGYPADAYEGQYNACFVKQSSWTGKRTKLISPKLNLSQYSDASLSFYYASAEDYPDHPNPLSIAYRTSPTDDWDTITHIQEQYPDWELVSVNLPELSEQYQISIESYAYLGYGSCVDNILITSSDFDIYSVSFEVKDQDDNLIDNAQISLDRFGTQYTQNGTTVFEYVAGSTEAIPYNVSKEGYQTHSSELIVNEDKDVSVVLQNVVNIEDNQNNELSVYPNPVGENINISNINNEAFRILIIDITGKQIKASEIKKSEKSHTLNVSNLKPGLYLMKITSPHSSRTLKFIKK